MSFLQKTGLDPISWMDCPRPKQTGTVPCSQHGWEPDMSQRNRRTFSPAQKADLLRKHHDDKVSISEVCNQNEPLPSMLYGWQHPLWDQSALAEAKPSLRKQQLCAEVVALGARLAKKEHVIAELRRSANLPPLAHGTDDEGGQTRQGACGYLLTGCV